MYKYRAIYFYRDSPNDSGLDLRDPNIWDGQELLDFETEEEIGSLEDFSKIEQMKEITAEVGRSSGHSMISIVKLVQGTYGGESFIQ